MRYISDKNISFSILVNGTSKRVRFTPKMQGGSIYITNDEAEIKALEETGTYKRGVFERVPGSEIPLVPDTGTNSKTSDKESLSGKKGKKVFVVEEITSYQDAIEYLVEKCGSDREKLGNPSNVLEEALAKGVSFPNIK